MERTLAEKRHNSVTKAIRKRAISKAIDGIMYDNLHQFSKNKILCNCPLCRPKVKRHRPAYGMEKGKKGGRWWSHSDVKRLVGMAEREREYDTIGYAS